MRKKIKVGTVEELSSPEDSAVLMAIEGWFFANLTIAEARELSNDLARAADEAELKLKD